MMARFFYTGFSTYDGVSGIPTGVAWTELLAVVSVCTMTLGNLTAIWQTNLKRLLAYSSIAHAGYMLMGVVMLSSAGLMAVMFYAAAYLFMNLGAFLVVLVLAQRLSSEDIADYVGLGWRSPWIAFCMSVFLFSLTGIPPTAGFVGKVYLFSAVIEGKLYWLAVAGAVNSAISLYYYARIVRTMYLERPQDPDRVSIPVLGAVSLGVLVAGTLVLGVYWEPLAVLAEQSTALFTPVSAGAQALLP